MQEAGRHRRHGEDPTFSALDEDDFQTVVIENKLGFDIYLKKVEQNADSVDQLHHGGCTSVWIPPPRFSDRLNVADESREARYYVAIQILEAKVVNVALVYKILVQLFIYYLLFYWERKIIFMLFSREYRSLMMEIAITFSVPCALSLIARQQINKSFFLRVRGQNVSSLSFQKPITSIQAPLSGMNFSYLKFLGRYRMG